MNNDTDNIFGDVIDAYTRAQAIEDGVLVDVSETAREAGFRYPVAVTQAVWQDCVAWNGNDNERQAYQDESGRLWDVLWMASCAVRKGNNGGDTLQFSLYRVPRDGKTTTAQLVTLKAVCSGGDDGEPVITILMPDED